MCVYRTPAERKILGSRMKSKQLACVVVAAICMVGLSAGASSSDVADRASKTIESFEGYCFQTNADHSAIKRMVSAAHLKLAPKELAAAAQPLSKGGGGEAYIVEWSKFRDGLFILLGFSKKVDSCSIYAQGIAFADIEKRLKSEYRLVFAQSNDVGLQISEMYVPGGTTGTVNDALENGIIMVVRPKPGLGKDGFTLGYMPPETVAKVFAQRGDRE